MVAYVWNTWLAKTSMVGGLIVEILLSPLPVACLCTVYMVPIGSHFDVLLLFTLSCSEWKLLFPLRWSLPPVLQKEFFLCRLYNFPVVFMDNFKCSKQSKELYNVYLYIHHSLLCVFYYTFCCVFITCYSICPSLSIVINLPLFGGTFQIRL